MITERFVDATFSSKVNVLKMHFIIYWLNAEVENYYSMVARISLRVGFIIEPVEMHSVMTFHKHHQRSCEDITWCTNSIQ